MKALTLTWLLVGQAAAQAPVDPRDLQTATLGVVPGGVPQGPEQGELFTYKGQQAGTPVLVMPVAPDRLDTLLGEEPDQVQLLVIPLVNEREPAGRGADTTDLPFPARDPFQPPPEVRR